jgi:very-short-patch-repair endonuclease
LRHRLELHGTYFRRQVQIGPNIADFANHHFKSTVEIDGTQHAPQPGDDVRARPLATNGYRVQRFWNNEVSPNIDGALTAIQSAITSTPYLRPSQQGE